MTAGTSMQAIDVSVVIAVKNEEVYLESAVLSVLQQQGVNHEVIVVDDGSTDRTPEILKRLAAEQPRLRVFRNPRAGKCSAFNLGIEQSTGTFACLFAGDYIMPPGSLAERWAAVRDHGGGAATVGLSKILTMSEDKRFDGHLVPRAKGRGALSGQSPLMNRAALAKIFPVPESLPNEDTWMELAVLHFPDWSVIHGDIVCCHWRHHAGNSINHSVGFDVYNRKITARMRALALFDEKYGSELGERNRQALAGKVRCEAARSSGDLLGVLRSPIAVVDRLRALSITNALFYGVRQRLYGLLSGW